MSLRHNVLSGNLFSDIPPVLPEEITAVLFRKEQVRIERIVSCGQVSQDWYDQESDEFVLVLDGEARLLFEKDDRSLVLKKGDYVMIPAHERHRVEWTVPGHTTVWLTVHM